MAIFCSLRCRDLYWAAKGRGMSLESGLLKLVEKLRNQNSGRSHNEHHAGYESGSERAADAIVDILEAHRGVCLIGCTYCKACFKEVYPPDEGKPKQDSTRSGASGCSTAQIAPCPICTTPMDDFDGGCVRHDPEETTQYLKEQGLN
jgi:hypothetical protein